LTDNNIGLGHGHARAVGGAEPGRGRRPAGQRQ
jgi:hypothetical protein